MRLIFKIAISLALIGFVCSRLDWTTVVQQFANQALVWLLAAALVVVGQIAIAALRWRIILAGLGISVSIRSVLSISYIASFFNCWLLGTVSGDVARALLAPRSDKGRAVIVHSVIIDRVMTLCGLSFGVLPVIAFGAGPLGKREWLPAELAVALIPIVALFLAAPIAEFVGSIRLPGTLRIREIAQSLRQLTRARAQFAAALALSALAGVAISMMAWCLGCAQHLGRSSA